MESNELSAQFWNDRYRAGLTQWDLGEASPPLKAYFDQLSDKNMRILIPGAGNAYEAEYLHQQGFTNVFVVDMAPEALQNIAKRVPSFPEEHLVESNFFDHIGSYGLIVEQTFFCALHPSFREQYVAHMHQLLQPKGKLVGLLFNAPLNNDKPPFGGDKATYQSLFEKQFEMSVIETAYNSVEPRAGRELFIRFSPKNQ